MELLQTYRAGREEGKKEKVGAGRGRGIYAELFPARATWQKARPLAGQQGGASEKKVGAESVVAHQAKED